MAFSKNKVLEIAAVVLRVAMGAAFVYAGYVKLTEPWQLFAANIADYEVVPLWAAKIIARSFPWFEVLLGLVLITGRWRRVSTVTVAGLLLFFVSLMAHAKLAGKEINCGCFSANEPISWRSFVRDGSMLAVALFLAAMAFVNRRKTA